MLRIAKSKSFCALYAAAAIWAVGPMMGSAADAATLLSKNSTLTINTTGSNPFITGWTVDGVDQYGGSPAGSEDFQINTSRVIPGTLSEVTPPVELNSLSLTSSFASGGLFSATYAGDGYTVVVGETLSGGNSGSGASALSEVITISNTGGDTEILGSGVKPAITTVAYPLEFELIQLSNLTLDATAGNDTLTLSPSQANTANQSNPLGTVANISATPTPLKFTGGTVGSQSASTGPFFGNTSFDFKWGGTIAVGDSFQVSINETVTGATAATSGTSAVPLPSAAKSTLTALAALAAIGLVRRMRKAIA